jgi:hypothetical protein
MVGGSGCVWHGRRLVPANSAHPAPGLSAAAVEDAAGIAITVEVDAWPRDVTPLERSVTPVRVTVDNHSGRAVLVRHYDFALRGGSGQAYAALAPDEVAVASADQPVTVVQPIFGPAGQAGSSNRRLMPPGPQPVPGLNRWETSFPYNSDYFHGYTVTPEVRRVQAVVRALPEGIVQDGGTVRGFVYFAGGAYGERRVLFEASLLKSPPPYGDGIEVAHARIPFRVR